MADQQVTILAQLIDQVSGPGRAVTGFLGGMQKDVASLNKALGPLTSQVGAFVAGFASVAGAKKALAAAEEAVNAERLLLQAVKGRREELERITAIAKDLQSRTTIDDDRFVRVATLLINMGVSVDKLDQALLAVVDTSAALDVGFEEVAKTVAGFDSGLAGRLAQRIPELRQLEEEGRLAADGLDLLTEKFRGNAEALADNDFGRAAREINEIGDSLERIGIVLAPIRAAFLQGLNQGIRDFLDAADTREARGFASALQDAAEMAGRLAPELAKVAGALAGIKLVGILTPLTLIVGQAAILFGFVRRIVAEVPAAEQGVERVRIGLSGVGDDVTEILRAIEDGSLELEDVVDATFTAIKNLAIFVDVALINPIVKSVIALGKTILGAIQVPIAKLALIGAQAIDTVVDLVLVGLDFVAGKFDALTAKIADALESIPGVSAEVAGRVRTDLRSLVPDDFTLLDKGLENLPGLVDEGLALVTDSFAEAGKAISEDFTAGLNEIDENDAAFTQRVVDRSRERISQSDQEADAKVAAERARVEQVSADIEALESQLAQIEGGRNVQAVQAERQRRLAEIEILLQQELISVTDFVREREAIESESIQRTLAERRAEIATLEENIRLVREAEGAQADVRSELQQLIDLRLEEQRIQAELGALQDKQLKDRVAFAQQQAAEIEELRRKLEEQSGVQGQAFSAAAAAGFNLELLRVGTTIDELIGKFPELSAVLGKLQEDLGRPIAPPPEGVDAFVQAFSAGATEVLQQTGDLDAGVKALGGTLVQGLGDGIVTAFTEGGDALKSFAANFLKQIAVMIARLVVFNALASAFGIPTGAAAVGGAGGAPGFAEGGKAEGPSGRDNIRARLSRGEWVIRERSAGYYGDRIMAAINARLIPRQDLASMLRGVGGAVGLNLAGRFAEGGPARFGRDDAPPVGMSVILSSERDADKFFAGGDQAFVRAFERNSDAVDAVKGRRVRR